MMLNILGTDTNLVQIIDAEHRGVMEMDELIEMIVKAFFLICIVVALVGVFIFVLIVLYVRAEDKEAIRYKSEMQSKEERERDETRKNLVFNTLGVEFDTLDDIETQDEIVRIVNLHAIEVAKACVAQDTTARRKKEEDFDKSPDERVKRAKRHWAEKRKIALALLPELAERIPHFSEFEPLKSYNAEHLLRKKEFRCKV